MKVRLFDAVGTGLIVKAKTGIVWSNQAGGVLCLQPQCEGVYVPFGNDVGLDHKVMSFENWAFQFFKGLTGGSSLQ